MKKTTNKLKLKIIAASLIIFAFTLTSAAQVASNKICPAPSKPCTDAKIKFKPHQLSFKIVKKGNVENGEPRALSASFYAVILKSMKSNYTNPNCKSHFSERERLAAQALFPASKVFASRYDCGGEDSFMYIDGNRQELDEEYNLMAVYAGETKTQAAQLLKKVKAMKGFEDANIRKMHIQIGYSFS